MSLSSFIAPTSRRPSNGYVTPQKVVSPSSTPIKLHPRVDIDTLPAKLISSETYLNIVIAQRFTDQDLLMYHSLLSCSQSLPAWIAIHDEIAIKLTGSPLFPQLPDTISEESQEMSHDDFSSFYAPGLSQNSSATLSMLHFFHYLYSRVARKSMD